MNKVFKAIAVCGIFGIVLTGCGKSEVTDADIAENLKPMTVAAYETQEETTAAEFCGPVIKFYGDYGSTVAERAKIRSESGSGNYSEEDLYKNVNDQQDAVQNLENHTKKYKITDNSNLQSLNSDFGDTSTKLIEGYNKARLDGTTVNLDDLILDWELRAQPLVMACADLK